MIRGARKAGLSRRHRFAGRQAFAPLLGAAGKIRGKSMLLHVMRRTGGDSRFGVALAKRQAPRAVDRNRLRRIARETFRLHPARSAGLDIVLSVRVAVDREGEAAWCQEFRSLLDRAVAAHP